MGEILSQGPSEIDLGIFGKFRSKDREMTYFPFIKSKAGLLGGKSSVKKMMEMGKSYDRLPPIDKLKIDPSPVVGQIPMNKMSKTTSRVLLSSTQPLSKEMLAAGLNPQARVNSYSNLAADPAKLLSTTFKKNPEK